MEQTECMYDYRHDRMEDKAKAIIVDRCDICCCDIYEGEEYYDILGTTICDDCISDFKIRG